MSSNAEIIQVNEFETSIVPVKIIEQRQQALWKLMAEAMEKGVDYGKTPGCGDKPSLFKPGSEKVLAMFQLAVDPMVEDLCPLGGGAYDEFRVRVHVTVKNNSRFVGKGVGECSSWEEKYKWRKAVTDGEYDHMAAIDPSLVRVKFGKDWQSKKEYQVKQVRVPTADIANTVVKMGKKRAQIDATLTSTAASAIFSQDLEDMPPEIAEGINESQAQDGEQKQSIKRPERKAETKAEAPKAEDKPRDPANISESQGKMLYAISRQRKLSDDELKSEVKRVCGVDHSREIKKEDFQKIIDAIDPGFAHHDQKK